MTYYDMMKTDIPKMFKIAINMYSIINKVNISVEPEYADTYFDVATTGIAAFVNGTAIGDSKYACILRNPFDSSNIICGYVSEISNDERHGRWSFDEKDFKGIKNMYDLSNQFAKYIIKNYAANKYGMVFNDKDYDGIPISVVCETIMRSIYQWISSNTTTDNNDIFLDCGNGNIIISRLLDGNLIIDPFFKKHGYSDNILCLVNNEA
jgi:hypothetical protein